jgi:tetratricopeptide (TPR) repeat protein
MKPLKWIIMAILLVVCAWGQANPDSLFVQGNRLYEQEQYQEAVQIYEQLLIRVENADLYYNLGNAYYRLGNLGQAVWAYEMGLALEPRDKDLNHNLAIANAQVRDRVEVPKAFFLLEWYRTLMKNVTLQDLISLGSIFILILAILYGLRSWQSVRVRWINRLSGTLVVLIILVYGLALDKYWSLSDKEEGVVIASTVEVRSAPIIRSDNVVFRLHEGIKMEITQSQPGWYEIVLMDGKKGWLAAGNVRLL